MEEDIKVIKRIWKQLPASDSEGRIAIQNLIARNKELEVKLKLSKELYDDACICLLGTIEKSKVIEIIENYYNEHGDTKEEITKFIEKLLQEGDK